MRRSATRKRAALSSLPPIVGCRHEALRLPKIKIAERCPRCRLFVRADGRTFALASEVAAAREAKQGSPQFLRADRQRRESDVSECCR